MITLLTLTGGRATAQEQPPGLQKVQGLNLPSSPGRYRTYYSPGYERRAEEAQRLIEEAARFYDSKLGFKVELSIALLDEAAWRKVNGDGPYGIPFVSAAPHVVFLPASDDNVITRSQAASQDKLTRAVREVMLGKGVLFIGLHELGHTYIEAIGIHTGNKWFTEFLASYYALAFLSQKHPKLAAAWSAATAAAGRSRPAHVTLEDFERLYNRVGPDNYGWYQAMFLKRAAQVYAAKRLKFLTEVNASFPRLERGEDLVDALIKRPETLEATLRRLEKISPGFIAWADTMK